LKFITVIAFLSFNLLLISPNYSAIQIDWEKMETPPFQIFYLTAEKHYTEELSTLLRSSYEELSRKLELPLASQVKVFFVPVR